MGIKTAVVPLLATALLLTGCAAAEEPAQSGSVAAADEISALGLESSDPRALVDALDALPLASRPAPERLTVSVLPSELLVKPGDISLPLDDEGFYLSIAPYATETHPCTFHSLTTCVGELRNAPIELRITDAQTGETVHEAATATADNGFVGVWLPRDRELLVSVTGEGADGARWTGEQTVRTGEGDPTCLTTLQLRA